MMLAIAERLELLRCKSVFGLLGLFVTSHRKLGH